LILSVIYLTGAGLAFSWAINAYRHGADLQAGFDTAVGVFAVGMSVAYSKEAAK